MNVWAPIVFSLMFSSFYGTSDGKKVAMKVVEEPSTFGMNAYNAQSPSNSLVPRTKPSNFSGPPHLLRLKGRCMKKVINDYKYEVCPFANVTQHEQSLRWNPYSGILGIWSEWEIENNTFIALVMREGDSCGDVFRSAKVFLDCGNSTDLLRVAEPATCQYEIHMSTPLTCHPDSMLVYPTLSLELQREWDLIESQLAADIITKKGYKKRLSVVFEKAGYILSAEGRAKIAHQASSVQANNDDKVDTLDNCRREHEKLLKEVQALKALLESHGIKHNTSTTPLPAVEPGVEEEELFPLHIYEDDHMDPDHF